MSKTIIIASVSAIALTAVAIATLGDSDHDEAVEQARQKPQAAARPQRRAHRVTADFVDRTELDSPGKIAFAMPMDGSGADSDEFGEPSDAVPDHVATAQRATELREAVQSEARDAQWSSQTSQTLDSIVRELPGLRANDFDCGVTMCRTVIEYQDRSIAEMAMEHVAQSDDFQFGGFVRYYDEADTPYAEVFVAREGHTIDPA